MIDFKRLRQGYGDSLLQNADPGLERTLQIGLCFESHCIEVRSGVL